jgi:hypothetical protein
MPDSYEYTATNPKTGERVGWNGKDWVPIPKETPSLWEAANTPFGKNVNIPTQRLNQRIADYLGKYPNLPWAARYASQVPLAVGGAVGEMGRRTLTPTGVGTMGFGALMEEIRQALNVPNWLKATTAIGETGMGGVFGVSGAKEALTSKPEENELEAIDRRLSGFGQAIMGLAPLAHASGRTVGRAMEGATARAMAYEVRDEINARREEHTRRNEQLQLEGLQKINDITAENERLLRESDEAHQKKVQETGSDNEQMRAENELRKDQIRRDTAEKNAKAHQEWREKAAKERREYEKDITQYNYAAQTSKEGLTKGIKTKSTAATEAETKRRVTAQRPHGPEYQRISEMAEKLTAQDVPKLDKDVRTSYNNNWSAWRVAMGDAKGSLVPMQDAIFDAKESILKATPNDIPIFEKILEEGGEEGDPLLAQASVFRPSARVGGLDIKSMLSNPGMTEATRNSVIRQLRDMGVEEPAGPFKGGAVEGAEIPIDDMRKYITGLMEKRARGSFQGEVYRALSNVIDAGKAEVRRVAQSKGQLGTYDRLVRDWAQYMEDFYDRTGPLTRVKNATNKENALNIITGDDNQRIIQALGRYAKFNPDLSKMVGGLRGMMTTISEYNSTTRPREPVRADYPKMPTPEEPKFPKEPKFKEEPEYKPPKLKEVPDMPDIVPFDTPKAVTEEVNKMAKKIGMTGHALMGYWILRDIFHGKAPSASMLAVPLVQRQISRYLRSPHFIRRVEQMVKESQQ